MSDLMCVLWNVAVEGLGSVLIRQWSSGPRMRRQMKMLAPGKKSWRSGA